ncbi:MAG: DUF2029 domain-containing protein [Alphaproteobacteria bacterium]|nr:DUF2029 domain-containing protein [Alphaproteobacteria bacterium]
MRQGLRQWGGVVSTIVPAIVWGRTTSPAFLLRVAAVFAAVVGAYDVLTITLFLSGGPLIGPQRWVLFPDFLVFHAAARAFFEGNLAIVYDFQAFVDFENRIYVDRFPSPVGFRPFLYPPTWLLMTLPVAFFGVALAYGLFMFTTAAVSFLLAGRSDVYGWLAAITSPAALWTMISGQNAFLTLGFFYGGMQLLTTSPIVAGILLGCLSYKPQLFALLPIALLAGRHWRALASAIATSLLLSAASLWVFGIDFWARFFEMMREASSPQIVDVMFRDVSIYMTTILAGARILGVPPALAGGLHLVGVLAALGMVWIAFRHYPHSGERTAVLAAGTLLLSPYMVNYDMLLLMPAAVILFRRRILSRVYPLEVLFFFCLWLVPNVGVRFNIYQLPIFPIFTVGFAWLAFLTLRAETRGTSPCWPLGR